MSRIARHILLSLTLVIFFHCHESYATDFWVDCGDPIFQEVDPTFAIEVDGTTPRLTHWQICDDPDFLADVWEEIERFSKKTTVPTLVTTSLADDQEYFFRARTYDENIWSEWSEPQLFLIERTHAYSRSKYVKEKVWEKVIPYLLPESHPIKPILDKIFSEERAILSIKTLEKAGFIDPKPRKWTHLIVTKHPEVPGYVFKIYLDAQRYFKRRTEYDQWLERIHGALAIQAEINKREWEHLFKVPKKWIYPLPEEPSPPKEFTRKNFILVEEDMDIFDNNTNYEKWKSDWVTKDKLEKVYEILEELGLHDCAKPDNIPFSKDGKIAFVDTQTNFRWPVLYKKLTPYLSPEIQTHWKKLIKAK